MTDAAHETAVRADDKSDGRAKPKRLSKRALRAWAWIAGSLAFFSPWAVLGIAPKPAAATAAGGGRQVVIIRKITRRIIVQAAPKPQPVHYVYVGGGSSGSVSAPVTRTCASGVPC